MSKITGPVAIHSVGVAITGLGERMGSALERPKRSVEDTPKRRKDALIRVQALERPWLGASRTVELMGVFEGSIAAVDGYMAIDEKDEELRKTWIKKRLGMPVVEEEDVFA